MSKLANNELNTENLQDTAQAENAVEITAKDEASTQQTEEVKVNADSLTENTEDKKSEDSVSADTDSVAVLLRTGTGRRRGIPASGKKY